MKNIKTEANSSFRFLKLNKLQAFTLEREVMGASQTKYAKNDDYLGCIGLMSDNLEDIVNFFIRQRIEVSDCDLFISVSSSSHSNTVDVSSLVNQMLKFIDCKLTFSYVVVADAK